jgi:hypothetical protein
VRRLVHIRHENFRTGKPVPVKEQIELWIRSNPINGCPIVLAFFAVAGSHLCRVSELDSISGSVQEMDLTRRKCRGRFVPSLTRVRQKSSIVISGAVRPL